MESSVCSKKKKMEQVNKLQVDWQLAKERR